MGESVLCFDVVKNTLKLVDFIGPAKVFTLSCQSGIWKDHVLALQTLKDTVFFLHETIEFFASMTKAFE